MLWDFIVNLFKKWINWGEYSEDNDSQLNSTFIDYDPWLGYSQCSLSDKYGQLKVDVKATKNWSFRGNEYYKLKSGSYLKILGVSSKEEGMLVVSPLKLKDEVLIEAKDINILDKNQEKIVKSLYE